MRFALSIKTKLFLAFFAVSLLVIATFAYHTYEHLRVSNVSHFQQELKTVAAIAALQVDGDVLEQLVSPEQEDSVPYQIIKQTLTQIAAAEPRIRFIYTLRQTAEPEVYAFVVDADDDPLTMAHIGTRYDGRQAPAMAQGFQRPSAEEEFIVDPWGKFLSGYAPIYNRQ